MLTLAGEAPAKINLTLRVAALRPDGFHEIESLVARVGLCDRVSAALRDDERLTLDCDDPALPRDETNLALQAAHLLRRTAPVRGGVHVSLAKRIPPGAGLGGGSSDAAAVLLLLNRLWQLRLGRGELASRGAQIGSDVPLFLHGPLCLVRGRGEQVEDVDRRLEGWTALILPGIQLATRDVYAAWDRTRGSGSVVQGSRLAVPGSESAIPASVGDLMPLLFNDLEAAAFAVAPELGSLAERLERLAGGPVRMTGSGAAFFRLYAERAPAVAFARRVTAATGLRVAVVPLATA